MQGRRTPADLMQFLYGEEEPISFDRETIALTNADVEDLLDLGPEITDETQSASGDEEVVGKPFALLRLRDQGQPLCFGRMHSFDLQSEDCRSCRFSTTCEVTARENRRRYKEWFERNSIGINDMGIVWRRDRMFPVKGVAAPPPPSEGPTSENARKALDGLRAFWLKKSADSRRHELQGDRSYQAHRRANPTAADLIERYHNQRLRLLLQALGRPRLDKRLQQVRGREEELAKFWKIARTAAHNLGRAPSDAELALIAGKEGLHLSRHQVRGRRLLVADLEAPRGPWAGRSSEELLPKPRKARKESI